VRHLPFAVIAGGVEIRKFTIVQPRNRQSENAKLGFSHVLTDLAQNA